eukprot:5999573-Pleurochrysis_carterae.AAC.1
MPPQPRCWQASSVALCGTSSATSTVSSRCPWTCANQKRPGCTTSATCRRCFPYAGGGGHFCGH